MIPPLSTWIFWWIVLGVAVGVWAILDDDDA